MVVKLFDGSHFPRFHLPFGSPSISLNEIFLKISPLECRSLSTTSCRICPFLIWYPVMFCFGPPTLQLASPVTTENAWEIVHSRSHIHSWSKMAWNKPYNLTFQFLPGSFFTINVLLTLEHNQLESILSPAAPFVLGKMNQFLSYSSSVNFLSSFGFGSIRWPWFSVYNSKHPFSRVNQ